MKARKHTLSIFLIIFITVAGNLYANTLFSGYAGGKFNIGVTQDKKPDLTLQAFFAGQFNFSQNVWSHVEFSIDTQNLVNEAIFTKTQSMFQIDELSLIMRANLQESTNYFSLFMGTYDPIGSDVFLQRYFGIEPISSMLTNSYMGLAGSILYPHFGIGISDVIKFYNKPIATGGYFYLNHEPDNAISDTKGLYVLNADLRFATVLRYFTCDIAGGIGFPLSDKKKEYSEDLIIAIDKLYWHMGATMLIGNNYTTSLFIQAGLYNASFTGKKGSFDWAAENIYLLFEPRFVFNNCHLNFSIFSLPTATVENLLNVEDSLGFDVNFYAEDILLGSQNFTFGGHLALSLKDKTLKDFNDMSNLMSNGFNLNITPYMTTEFLSGQLHAQVNINFMEIGKNINDAFSVDVGYRTRF